MLPPQPIYTIANTTAAYQLNWSLTLFLRRPFPFSSACFDALREITEVDSVRILEHQQIEARQLRFFVSTQPPVSPAQVIRSVKGRLQYLIRGEDPKLFQRNYSICSVGDPDNDRLHDYVAKQPSRHRMADPRVQEIMESLQFLDEQVDLKAVRLSSYGQYLYNLHIVLENHDHLHNVHESHLRQLRSMIIRACERKQQLLARIGMVTNHMHLLLGCDIRSSPQEVALSLMNNMAYVMGMKAMTEFSYYVGTFGPYNRNAIRRSLAAT